VAGSPICRLRERLQPLLLPDPDVPSEAVQAERSPFFVERACNSTRISSWMADRRPWLNGWHMSAGRYALAIELADARIEALELAQLLDRLDGRFGLLNSANWTVAARQRSPQATPPRPHSRSTPDSSVSQAGALTLAVLKAELPTRRRPRRELRGGTLLPKEIRTEN
jgi:hypothetical protein